MTTSEARRAATENQAANEKRPDLVICGLDASAWSHNAADWAASEAVRRHATLELLHAYEVVNPFTYGGAVPAVGYPGYVPDEPGLGKSLHAEGLALLERVGNELRRAHPGLSVRTRLVQGDPVTALRIESGRAGLTVLGSHGTGRVASMILGSVAPWSGCWFFAIFTGGLLWLSSLFAAWADNWFALHQLSPALAQHRDLQRWFGPTRTRRFALWLEHNIAGLAGNISLGLMLGIIPSVAVFFGLPLDVRHVTLSTGQVTAAFAMLGSEQIWMLSTVWIVVGILGIGLLNILVSFSLALFVAIRARNVRGPELQLFRRALLKRVLKSPLSFVLPVGVVQSNNSGSH